MFKKFYIRHEDVRTPENGVVYFGPFKRREIGKRLNDALGDLLAYDGDLEAVKLGARKARQIYINPRERWIATVKELTGEHKAGIARKLLRAANPMMPWR